jgi:hypothetical protein
MLDVFHAFSLLRKKVHRSPVTHAAPSNPAHRQDARPGPLANGQQARTARAFWANRLGADHNGGL